MIQYELEEETAWVTLDRPEKANALDHDACESLAAALDRAETEARAAVVTGSDDSAAFCAGDDIRELAAIETTEDLEEHFELISGVLHGIEEASVPVIAASNGDALGGGFELVLACDLAVATEGSSFSLPETTLGTFPSFAVERLAVASGRKRLMELVLTGRQLSAESARDAGLINDVVPPGELDDVVAEYVADICASPGAAIGKAKSHANSRIRETGELDRMVGGNGSLFLSEETTDGIDAFIEGRTPSWQQ